MATYTNTTDLTRTEIIEARATDPQTWVRFDSGVAEWVSCEIDPEAPAWTVCGRAVGADERATHASDSPIHACMDCA